MNVDIQSLGTVSRTARMGAERAARNLTGLTGIETAVEVTKVTMVSADDLATDEQRVGVAIDLSGGVDGASLLTLSTTGVETLTDTLLADETVDQSAIAEVGNVVTNGFVDSWADHLDETIEVSPPRYVEGTGRQLLDVAGFDRDRAFVFRSEVSAVGEALDVELHLFPDRDSMRELLAGDDEVPVEKLAALREIARTGAQTASESVSEMTGIDTDVDVTRLSFVPVEDVPAELRDEPYVGAVLEFEASPGGYVLILFGESSAREVVTALMPGSDGPDASNGGPKSGDPEAGQPFDGVEQSAMEEIANVMTSSFIDGWANVLDTTIDHSTPQFVHDMGRAIAESVVARLGQRQAESVLFDATLRAADREFDCNVYVLPDEDELRDTLDELDPDETAERTTKAGSL